MWPHGVRVAFVGAEKHMGHVYAERGSESGLAGRVVVVGMGFRASIGESGITIGESSGMTSRCFPFPLRSVVFPLPFLS